jgi:lysophospholipid acyltransferase (LPLAT)-like uncharacterized protein
LDSTGYGGSTTKLIDRAATAWGRLVARYSRAMVGLDLTDVVVEAPLAHAPTVWIGWHESNLLTLALHGRIANRAAMAFVPPGLNGAAMRGWLEGLDVIPVPLAADARRGLGLRPMESALAAGKDVLIAVDGPNGPRHRIAPGAIWLARAMQVEVRPVGSAAWPALRLPRWDRLIVPLPVSRVSLVIGPPLLFKRLAQKSGEAAANVATILHELTERANDIAQTARPLKHTETMPWR